MKSEFRLIFVYIPSPAPVVLIHALQVECFHFNDTLFQQKTGASTKSNNNDDSKSGGNENIDILKTEGQPGWMEKLLKEVREHL